VVLTEDDAAAEVEIVATDALVPAALLPAQAHEPADRSVARSATGEPPHRPGPQPAPATWECHGGAASAPLRYRRREPEKTLLHAVARERLESFLAQARERSHSRGLPDFVERELRPYTECGILARAFAMVRCPDCGFERLVAFSCKASICPSCATRRMEDGADHLVRNVLPAVPVRQWVLSFLRRVRFLAARHPALASRLLDIFTRAVRLAA